MKKIVCMSLALLLVVGCSTKPKPEATPEVTPNATQSTTPDTSDSTVNSNETSMVCGMDSGNQTITSTFGIKEGVVTTFQQSITYRLDANEDAESIKKSFEDDKANMSKEKGITYDITESDTEIVASITYDLNEVSGTILSTLGLNDDVKTDGKFDSGKIREFLISNNAMCQGF